MLEAKILTGGYINSVSRMGNVVVKQYTGDALIGIDAKLRKRREEIALNRFGDTLSPHVIFSSPTQLNQEFVPGNSFENLAQEGDESIFEEAGSLLSRIHTPLPRDPQILKQRFEKDLDKHTKQALPILIREGIDPRCDPSWDAVYEAGTTRVHRDFWFGNIIKGKDQTKVIDWELAGIGSPYEDLAIVDLWVFRQYGHKEDFYRGYGKEMDDETVSAFLKAKCIQFLSTTTIDSYANEEPGGFYHNKVDILKSL